MPFRETLEDTRHDNARNGISCFMAKVAAFARARQVDVVSGAVLKPSLPLRIPERTRNDAQQARQRITGEAFEVHAVDEGLNGITFQRGQAVLTEGRFDIELDSRMITIAK